MGSPSSRLNTPEHLRVWLESGLEYVFHPGAADQSAQAGPVPEATAPEPQAPSRPAPQKTPVHAEPAARQSPAQGAGQGASKPTASQTSASETASVGFPEPWATFLGKVPATHTMVWTYMELGLDLGGQPDPRRRALMGDLIKHLKLPPGPVAFWPVAVLSGGALQPDRTMFWKGWQSWQTPHIVCFGQDSLKVILPDADPSLTMHMLDNVMVHVLPSVQELLAMLPHERQMAVDPLASIR